MWVGSNIRVILIILESIRQIFDWLELVRCEISTINPKVFFFLLCALSAEIVHTKSFRRRNSQKGFPAVIFCLPKHSVVSRGDQESLLEPPKPPSATPSLSAQECAPRNFCIFSGNPAFYSVWPVEWCVVLCNVNCDVGSFFKEEISWEEGRDISQPAQDLSTNEITKTCRDWLFENFYFIYLFIYF